MFRSIRLPLLLLALLAGPLGAKPPLVLAAASLQEALTEVGAAWARRGHETPTLSFAASSALARQVEAGADADLFLSADEAWMDHLQQRALLRPGTRADLLGNRLALVAPADSRVRITIGRGMPLIATLAGGRLAMADPASVPAGRYGRAALESLGVWRAVAGRVAQAESVRAALALVERGEAPLGIVYATDARASRRVRLIGLFPSASHPPIRYPAALLASSRHPEAEPFRRFLFSREAGAIFRRRGFLIR